MSYDITFCMNRKCNIVKCERNLKRIKPENGKVYYSCAFLEGTEYCLKKKGGVI